MATVISKSLGKGGAGTATASGPVSLRDVLVEMVDDLTAIAEAFNALLEDYNGHDHVASATAEPVSAAAAVTLGTSYE